MTTTTDTDLRTACAALLARQRTGAPAAPPPDLKPGLARLAPTGLEIVEQRLLDDAPLGALTDELAALLRPPGQAFDEAQEIDWAVRHWEGLRAAGLLDEELAADFGEFWRRLEWSGVRQHLAQLGAGHAEERRLLAYLAKVASRYVALAPLKRALEARHPELFDLGFSLR